MDAQATVRTYGNSDLPEGTPERPLVTFALFAYNQEKYIREAVEGAFSQTYSPLEIILSDDCSSDRTFEIMEEMLSAYNGPHRVVARRNSINLMTALHVQFVANEMSGKLLVVAAGDDISLPNRVERLVEVWTKAGRPVGVVHSGWDTFRDQDGALIRRRVAKRPLYPEDVIRGYAKSDWLPAAAPTVAYTSEIFRQFRPLSGGSVIEDAPLLMRAAMIGKFVSCDDPLVRVRMHDANTGTGYALDRPSSWNRFLQSKIVAFRTMQADLAQYGSDLDPTLRVEVERRILGVVRSASQLMIPEACLPSLAVRASLVVRLCTAPAVSPRLRVRLEYMLRFFGFTFQDSIRNKIYAFLSARRRVRLYRRSR